MRILNLYAGLGGNRKLWKGDVTAVEKDPKIADVYKANYPDDTIVVGDAHEFLLHNHDDFDFIWASPPCQSHSKMVKATRHDICKYPDMKLYEEILFLTHFSGAKWVVENVVPYYEPLVKPSAQVGRHLFWSNFHIGHIEDVKRPDNFINLGTLEGVDKLKEWLGIQYDGSLYYDGNHCPAQVLRNCVHPLIGKQIFDRQEQTNGQQQLLHT
jgi:DNA (cytosine-5)-methyltransferase 1